MKRTTISLAVASVMDGRAFFRYEPARIGMTFNNVTTANLAALLGLPFAPMANPPHWHKQSA